jgi:fibrinogen beta/gamma subunit family protein
MTASEGNVGWVLAASLLCSLTGCDEVVGLRAVTHDARPKVAMEDAAPDAKPIPVSCNAIAQATPSALSGTYEIYPDGLDGGPPVMVTCDMTTDGGGWTIIFVAPSTNLTASTVAYTTNVSKLLTTAQETLLTYRDASLKALAGAARLAMPPDWRVDTPFDYPETDVPTMVSIDGAPAVAATLRYGYLTFQQTCDGAWLASQTFGRVCVTGTTAPFYNGFDLAGGDWCPDSNASYTDTPCAADRQFSIAIR